MANQKMVWFIDWQNMVGGGSKDCFWDDLRDIWSGPGHGLDIRVFHHEDLAYGVKLFSTLKYKIPSGGISQIDAFATGDLVFMGGTKFLPVWLSPQQIVVQCNILMHIMWKDLLSALLSLNLFC